MNSRNRIFAASFAITVIMIGATASFIAVDLSTERYMPDRFGPLFSIGSIAPSRVEYSFLGQSYALDFAPLYAARQELRRFRGLLPAAPRAASSLAAVIAQSAIERLDAQQTEE